MQQEAMNTSGPMQGFDAHWHDPAGYILGVTREIWEDRGVATLRKYYTGDIPVRSPAGLIVGNEAVIAATLATLAEFPDRELLGEDVIWSAADTGGFLSSHRIYSTVTHVQAGAYGAASGKRLGYRVIADCAARANQIYDEWLVRDQGAIVRQLGIDPKAHAADLIAREGGPEACAKPFTPDDDRPGAYTGRGNDHPIGSQYCDMLESVMAGDLATIASSYDRACELELPGGRTGHGQHSADSFWLGLRAAFPSARFEIHHAIGRDDPGMPQRAAVRWSLQGSHDGPGLFGAPSGASVHVMAISHAEFGPRGLKREFVLYDETAIWKQIMLKTG